jgi:hypothetical protein
MAAKQAIETGRRDAALSRVRRARARILQAESAEVRAVVDARLAGATWDQIAGELGVKQPNAVRKYGAAVRAAVEPGQAPGAAHFRRSTR